MMNVKHLPRNTQVIITQEAIHNASQTERCRLMREIVRGAKFFPMCERMDEAAERMTKPTARFARV